ncbi:protein N-terminal asparagine amidohydrolase-like [Diabrotica virgifera virgifera]|uniref:Protein N-terminal asparagine amidohydrolase-like n=1 Tax=Diabrotica virgifera virgifera TaxID=50390 RepID=A0A6P7GRB8_DIAVI|nr:protein N-terminal asparagine amidohydrolase-like [Diabrotica virgifera virgifera]
MVLVLNGVLQTKSPPNTQTLYNAHPIYKETATQLLSIPSKIVGPAGLLYVLQREFAAVNQHDKNVTILGSDDATTCILVILRHSGSGAVALAHFDGLGTHEAASAMVEKIQELAVGYSGGRIELQLVGGFSDRLGYSEELFYNIMDAFHKQLVEIDLTLACIGQLNTTIVNGIPAPIIYGVGVNMRTNEIFPASFPQKGPEEYLRTARHLFGSENCEIINIYDCILGQLKIGPFNYKPLRGANLWLEQNDDFILQQLSTSPEVEPPHFVSNVRGTVKYIQENPFPAVTVFRNNRPLYYRRDEDSGLWVPDY